MTQNEPSLHTCSSDGSVRSTGLVGCYKLNFPRSRTWGKNLNANCSSGRFFQKTQKWSGIWEQRYGKKSIEVHYWTDFFCRKLLSGLEGSSLKHYRTHLRVIPRWGEKLEVLIFQFPSVLGWELHTDILTPVHFWPVLEWLLADVRWFYQYILEWWGWEIWGEHWYHLIQWGQEVLVTGLWV